MIIKIELIQLILVLSFLPSSLGFSIGPGTNLEEIDWADNIVVVEVLGFGDPRDVHESPLSYYMDYTLNVQVIQVLKGGGQATNIEEIQSVGGVGSSTLSIEYLYDSRLVSIGDQFVAFLRVQDGVNTLGHLWNIWPQGRRGVEFEEMSIDEAVAQIQSLLPERGSAASSLEANSLISLPSV